MTDYSQFLIIWKQKEWNVPLFISMINKIKCFHRNDLTCSSRFLHLKYSNCSKSNVSIKMWTYMLWVFGSNDVLICFEKEMLNWSMIFWEQLIETSECSEQLLKQNSIVKWNLVKFYWILFQQLFWMYSFLNKLF